MENGTTPGKVAGEAAALEDARAEIEQLTAALESRTVIGYAVGIVMVRKSLTAEAAFAQLIEMSSHANVKLREIATQVVAEADRRGRELPQVMATA